MSRARCAGIAVWKAKRQYDAVRPFSAIRHVYGSQPVTAWGGPGVGTVSDIPADEWTSFGQTADHPEYPSASACACAAHAQAARAWQGDDVLNVPIKVAKGSSRVEPGVTPAEDLQLFYPTWTAMEAACAQSRLDAGYHFKASVDASLAVCGGIGAEAHAYVQSLIDGSAPVRPPARGRAF
jgi:hypothetical protein